MKRFLCLFLVFCLSLSLAACAAPEPEAPAQKPGRWIEEVIDVPMPQGAKSYSLFGYNDTLEAVFYDDAHLVAGWSRSEDFGESWQPLDISFFDELLLDFSDPYCDFRVGENGVAWFHLREKTTNEKISSYLRNLTYMGYDGEALSAQTSEFGDELLDYHGPFNFYYVENGEAFLVPFSLAPRDVYGYYIFFHPLADGSCLFRFPGATIKKVDREGTITRLFEVNDYSPFYFFQQVYGDLALCSQSIVDLSTGEQTELPFSSFSDGCCGLAPDGSVYSISNEKIQKVAPGSTLAEELASGKDYFFGSPGNHFRALLPIGNYLFAQNGDSSSLLRYYYDPEALPLQTEEITVFSMHDTAAVRQTISQLRLTQPGLSVNYRIGDNEISDSMTKDDFIKSLNTELLAGVGPDVLILDDLATLNSYLESGVFVDLTDLVDVDGLFPNLIETGRYNGGLYAVPAGIIFPAVMSCFSDVERLLDGVEPEEILTSFSDGPFPYSSISGLLEKSREQAQRNIRQRLGTEGRLKQIYLLNPTLQYNIDALYCAALPELSGADTDPEIIRSFLQSMSWMDPTTDYREFSHNPYELAEVELVGMSSFSSLNYQQVSPLSSFSGKNMFLPRCVAAIPQKSQLNENAVAFINAMLSPQVQSQLTSIWDNIEVGGMEPFSYLLTNAGTCLPVRESCIPVQNYLGDTHSPNTLKAAILQLDTPLFLNLERATQFVEITRAYLNNDLTLDEATDQIMASYTREDTLSALEHKK